MLCPTCEECCRDVILDGGRSEDLSFKGRPHHDQPSDLERSAADGCQICLVLLEHRTKTLEGFGPAGPWHVVDGPATRYHNRRDPEGWDGMYFTHHITGVPWSSFNVVKAPGRFPLLHVKHSETDEA